VYLEDEAESDPEVKVAIEESIVIIKTEQREDGLIDGFEGYESASTGLAVWALSAAGEDASFVTGQVLCVDGGMVI
jgi:NAD(P)-dependent dehydrogenase (short-subunit alcohol dehydrogenase family)